MEKKTEKKERKIDGKTTRRCNVEIYGGHLPPLQRSRPVSPRKFAAATPDRPREKGVEKVSGGKGAG